MFGPAFERAFSAPFDRNIAAAAVPWYLAGGAPTPIAVYEPLGKADLATSYVNLITPGTYNAAPGTAPTFDAATGWTFNGTTQYLTTGVVPASGYSMLVRVADMGSDVGWIVGAYNSSGNNRFSLGNPNGANRIEYGSGKTVDVVYGATVASGVLAVAGQQGYRDGSPTGAAIAAWNGAIVAGLEIARLGGLGGSPTLAVKIQVLAIYPDTLTALQVAAVSAAMAAL